MVKEEVLSLTESHKSTLDSQKTVFYIRGIINSGCSVVAYLILKTESNL